jgi:hypothetical protein
LAFPEGFCNSKRGTIVDKRISKAKGADLFSQKIVLAPLDGRIEEFTTRPFGPQNLPNLLPKNLSSSLTKWRVRH